MGIIVSGLVKAWRATPGFIMTRERLPCRLNALTRTAAGIYMMREIYYCVDLSSLHQVFVQCKTQPPSYRDWVLARRPVFAASHACRSRVLHMLSLETFITRANRVRKQSASRHRLQPHTHKNHVNYTLGIVNPRRAWASRVTVVSVVVCQSVSQSSTLTSHLTSHQSLYKRYRVFRVG